MDLNGIEEVIERPDDGHIAHWRQGDAWLGGGTWLFSEPQPDLRRLLDLRGFGWTPLEACPSGLTIAATCSIAELERFVPPLEWRAAALAPPCCRALLGSFKVWNGATVGGNLCLALPAGPMTALAVALEGACCVWSRDGVRAVPAAAFVTGPGANALRPGELLRAIELPAEALGRHAAFRQISLTPQGRSGALLIGTVDAGGAFRLTVTASTVRPIVLRYGGMPTADALVADLAGMPDETIFADVHGGRAWRRAVTAHLAVEIRDELAR